MNSGKDKKISNWIEGMSLELKGRRRIRYLKMQLSAEGHWDGWVIKALRAELAELRGTYNEEV
jgi:hypothetical protein